MSKPVEKLTYEEALAELEQITSQLETSQKSLEETLSNYERGQALAKHCNDLLDQAELKLKTLSSNRASADNGSLEVE